VFLASDALDGYFARKLNQVTDFGEYLDFVADFTGYYALLGYFVVVGRMAWYNITLLAVATLAFFWVAIMLSKKAGRAYMPHRRSSKILAFLLIIGIVGFMVNLTIANLLFLVVMVVIYVYPLADYLRYTHQYPSKG